MDPGAVRRSLDDDETDGFGAVESSAKGPPSTASGADRWTTYRRRAVRGAISIGVAGGETSRATVPWVLRFIGMSGMDVGRDAGSPITDAYQGPFPFTGGFASLEFEVTEELDPAEIMRRDRDRVRQEFSRQ